VAGFLCTDMWVRRWDVKSTGFREVVEKGGSVREKIKKGLTVVSCGNEKKKKNECGQTPYRKGSRCIAFPTKLAKM